MGKTKKQSKELKVDYKPTLNPWELLNKIAAGYIMFTSLT